MEPKSEKEISTTLRSMLNRKAPGGNQLPNFWHKQLAATRKYLATCFKN